MLRWYSCFILLGLIASPAYAQRELKDIPIPDAEEERKTFVVSDGFEVNLFAADPQIHKPIQINFDPEGRLWVAASEVYPQIAPGQPATDKILVLHDEDGDGVSDKTTVFADGLLIPTGVEPGDGGAYVANSTELLHLADTDGDGKADRSRIVLSGFGTEDTHHIIHTFRWGPEGLFYFNQSIYIHSHVETPYGVRRLNAGGIWQFRPETLRLDVFARGWVNTWGHAFDRWGQSFVTDGAGGEGINYLVPGASYVTAQGAARILKGLNPGSPKYCGLEMVDGRHLPDDWQGNLIAHDFRGHRVCRFQPVDDGSGFASRQLPDLITSNHVAFRPIDVKQGPDGAIYIADWYNPIIQHGEVDFRDPRRDHTHGRIWRVTAKGRPLVKRTNLAALSVRDLLNQLDSPETNTRMHAKRLLKEHDRDTVLRELTSWVRHLDIEFPNYEPRLLEAMWVFQALDEARPAILSELLRASDPRIRAAAVRQLPHWKDREGMENGLAWLEERISDESPRVRLETVCALRAYPSEASAAIALRALDLPMDQFLDYALWQTIRELRPHWVPAAAAGTLAIEGRLPRLLFAIRAAEVVEAIPPLVEQLNAGAISDADRPAVLDVVATLGGPDHLRLVFDLAKNAQTPPERAAELLRALASAQLLRQVRPAGDLAELEPLIQSDQPQLAAAAMECLGAWKLASAGRGFAAALTDANRPLLVRLAAVQALAALGDESAREVLAQVSTEETNELLSASGLSALVALQPQRAAKLAVAWLAKSRDGNRQTQVFAAFLQQKGASEILAAALADQKLPEDIAKIGLRTVTGAGRQEPLLTEALTKAGGISSQPKPLTEAELAALLADIKAHGDPARGEALFRRTDLACFKCHAIGGAGGKVGPDLLSIGASAQVDYLVDSLLLPNKNVKEGYHSVVVQTDDGKVLSGIKVREAEGALLIRDAEDREIAIPLKSIDEQGPGTSLMPAGLVEKLTRDELVDLVRFLSELGKPGPFAVSGVPTARKWETLQPTKESYTRLTRTSDAQLLADDVDLQWTPVYSTVSGDLPVNGLPTFTVQFFDRHVAFARVSIDVTTAGTLNLGCSDLTGLTAWLDGRPITLKETTPLPLSSGSHKLAFAIDVKKRQQPVRLTLPGGDGATAQGQFATGK